MHKTTSKLEIEKIERFLFKSGRKIFSDCPFPESSGGSKEVARGITRTMQVTEYEVNKSVSALEEKYQKESHIFLSDLKAQRNHLKPKDKKMLDSLFELNRLIHLKEEQFGNLKYSENSIERMTQLDNELKTLEGRLAPILEYCNSSPAIISLHSQNQNGPDYSPFSQKIDWN